jgi:hypothetical protein
MLVSSEAGTKGGDMATKANKTDAAAGRAEIEAQIARVRGELATLGYMMAEYGVDRLRGAEMQAVAELQRQLESLESGVRRRMDGQPLQALGLAALAGFVLGLVLRR